MKLVHQALLLTVIVQSVYMEECQPIEHCGALFRKPPSCPRNGTSEAIRCLNTSCEGDHAAIKQLLEVHEKAEETLCKIYEQNKTAMPDMCWLTAVACARGHIIGDKAKASPEICYMRKHGIEKCVNMGGPTCSAALDDFFQQLYSDSKCCASQHLVNAPLVILATIGALFIRR